MKIETNWLWILTLAIILLSVTNIDAKGGRGGGSRGGSSSRGSSSRGSSGGGWLSSSRSSSSYSRPSSSYTHSAPSPSYTHSAPAPSYGWNVPGTSSSTYSKPSSSNIGWNTHSPSSPVGPPPAYPGLQNRHVPSHNAPPAYSPSYHNPPAYSPTYNSRPYYSSGSHNTYSSYPGYTNSYYGNTFGRQGLGGNTYISNNYYGNHGSSSSGFLTNALFYGAGTHSGYSWGRNSHYYSHYHHHHYHGSGRRWDENDDRQWRATTQGPYFANKVPGEDKILPAAAVIGAATAFGLISLLPLNVPANKPLMYCNNTDLMQAQIRIDNGYIYQCINNTIEITCPTNLENGAVAETDLKCINRTVQCDLDDDEIFGDVYCKKGTVLSKSDMFCNSTTAFNVTMSFETPITVNNTDGTGLLNDTNQKINETAPMNVTSEIITVKILNCYEGQLPESQVAFIPTTTQAPPPKSEKPLSFNAKLHIFLLHLIGQQDVLETTTTPEPDIPADDSWVPEALTIPPETTTTATTTTTTTEPPFVWMEKKYGKLENGSFVLEPIPDNILRTYISLNDLSKVIGTDPLIFPRSWTKVYITTTPMVPVNETQTEDSISSTEASTIDENSVTENTTTDAVLTES